MWPKLLMQLFELLPHASRLIPVADKYFAQRSAKESVMAETAEEIRGELGQMSKANAGLYRQLQEQAAQIHQISEDVQRTRTAVDQHDHRLEAINHEIASLGMWIKGGVSVIVVLLAVAIWLLARGH
jgi:septal ring factor EnvC (AmiA/AmiB activator)